MDLSKILIIDKTKGKPHAFVASYTARFVYDISELDIDWDKVENVWCKHTTLYIELEDGTQINVENYDDEAEIDYKWPVQLQLFDEDYNQLWEE